jgi:CDP-diacylglycerol pyrophosphatase
MFARVDSGSKSSQVASSTKLATLVAGPALAIWARAAVPGDDPNALWTIVHQQCVPHQQQFATPLPCAEVDEAAGYAILKDRNGASQFLLLAVPRVSGIEDAAILAPDAPNFWLPAWPATRFVQALLGKALPRESLALAINSSHYGRRTSFTSTSIA